MKGWQNGDSWGGMIQLRNAMIDFFYLIYFNCWST